MITRLSRTLIRIHAGTLIVGSKVNMMLRNCSTKQHPPKIESNDQNLILNFLSLQAIVAMEFDSNGSLLLTCDRLGNYFNLFRIVPHPAGSCYASVHHLYSLYRGDTPGSVQVRHIYLT
jgi:hypothetical protein